jgi:hypothetical protein
MTMKCNFPVQLFLLGFFIATTASCDTTTEAIRAFYKTKLDGFAPGVLSDEEMYRLSAQYDAYCNRTRGVVNFNVHTSPRYLGLMKSGAYSQPRARMITLLDVEHAIAQIFLGQ